MNKIIKINGKILLYYIYSGGLHIRRAFLPEVKNTYIMYHLQIQESTIISDNGSNIGIPVVSSSRSIVKGSSIAGTQQGSAEAAGFSNFTVCRF